jgi:hypothetical protein
MSSDGENESKRQFRSPRSAGGGGGARPPAWGGREDAARARGALVWRLASIVCRAVLFKNPVTGYPSKCRGIWRSPLSLVSSPACSAPPVRRTAGNRGAPRVREAGSRRANSRTGTNWLGHTAAVERRRQSIEKEKRMSSLSQLIHCIEFHSLARAYLALLTSGGLRR